MPYGYRIFEAVNVAHYGPYTHVYSFRIFSINTGKMFAKKDYISGH